nr:MAG TPA: hypothetical protein [Caudoviricetes sp.]
MAADVKIIGVPCIDSCLNSLEGDLSKYVDEGYIITGQCITPQGNIIYTLVKNVDEAKIAPAPTQAFEEIDIDFVLETLEADWIKNKSRGGS